MRPHYDLSSKQKKFDGFIFDQSGSRKMVKNGRLKNMMTGK